MEAERGGDNAMDDANCKRSLRTQRGEAQRRWRREVHAVELWCAVAIYAVQGAHRFVEFMKKEFF